MSDPSRGHGSSCHGPMIRIELREIAEGDCLAICEQCGVVRHLLPFNDPRRALVEAEIPSIIASQFDARGEVR